MLGMVTQEARDYLVRASNYGRVINRLTRAIDGDKVDYPTPLEPLVALGSSDRDAFESLLREVERERRDIPVRRKVDYQRELMRERRARLAKAIELAELTGGKMTPAERKERAKVLTQTWARAKAEFLAGADTATWGGRLAATRQFWCTLDNRLDQNLADARKARGL